jgi:hypothetical protein
MTAVAIVFILLNVELLLLGIFLTLRGINRSIKHQTALDELDREERAEAQTPSLLAGRR